jgi:hypothetical protein
MSSNLLGELVANNGTYFLSGGGYGGNIDQIIVRGDGVIIGKIYVNRDGEEVDIINELLSDNVVPNGLRITPQNNEVFTSVLLGGSSGSGSGLELVLA